MLSVMLRLNQVNKYMNSTQKKIIKMYEMVRVAPSQAYIARKLGIARSYVNFTLKEWLKTKSPRSKVL